MHNRSDQGSANVRDSVHGQVSDFRMGMFCFDAVLLSNRILMLGQELLGTKPWYGVDVESHGEILRELAQLLEKGEVKTHLQQKFRLDVDGLRKAHEAIENGSTIGKNGLSVDFGKGNTAFT